MMTIDLDRATHAAICQFYFVQRCRLEAISDVLQLPRSAVRRALVLPGGVSPISTTGPYRMESDS